jgi:multidrug efflux pump subunit AcrA (membrane-fusion protein)
MMSRTAAALLLLAAAALAQDGVAARRGSIRETADRRGTFVPAGAPEIELALEVYKGELRLVEVLPHGSPVNPGDVLARLDAEAAAEQLQRERMALERLSMDLRQLEEKNRMQEEKDARALASAEREFARAETRLRGFREHEKAHRDEDERLDIHRAQSRLEDQQDELTQLEKMYGEDELVDATEEIVLKRERREFARAQSTFTLNETRRAYRKQFFEPWHEEDLEEDVKQKASALDQTRRSQAQAREREAADVAQKRYEIALQERKAAALGRDVAQLVVRAPQGGLLLHGPMEAAPWKRLEPDAALKNREVFATVADPKRLRVLTDLGEKHVLGVAGGVAAEIVPDAMPDRTLVGRLKADYLPQKEGVFRAEVALDEVPVGLRPGMACKVRVVLGEEKDAVLVPNGAVATRPDGTTFVKCAKAAAGPFEERTVVVGRSDGKDTAVREGVAEGEFVLVEKK